MTGFNLRAEAVSFAGELTHVLNQTVCNGIRLTSVVDPRTDQAIVGLGIVKDDLRPRAIPLTTSAKAPVGYLGFVCRLAADDTTQRHLMVVSSFISYCVDEDLDREILHFDYERNKADGYPEAHLQVCADSGAWDEVAAKRGLSGRPLAKLHLPVGGRRYRPTLEDVVDFLICEGLADGRDGWEEAVREGRERFHALQLRAAVRRLPDIAREVLAELDREAGAR